MMDNRGIGTGDISPHRHAMKWYFMRASAISGAADLFGDNYSDMFSEVDTEGSILVEKGSGG